MVPLCCRPLGPCGSTSPPKKVYCMKGKMYAEVSGNLPLQGFSHKY